METERLEHPSFGMVGLARCQSSGTVLVASDILHSEFISLSIKKATRDRDLSQDWWRGHEELIEVLLSPVQFASLLTTMNVGDGVPCTINHLSGQRVPNPPKPDSNHVVIHREFQQTCRDSAAKLDEAIRLAEAGYKTAAQRNALVDALKMARQEIASNLPFVEQSFTEATQHTINEAKAEVEAFVTHTAIRTGLEHLRKFNQLPSATEEPGKEP